MNTIYVDILIFINIFIDFFVLCCVKNFLHIKAKLSRLILGSVIGSFFSLWALLPTMMFFINIIFGFVTAVILIFITFGKCAINTFITRVSVYFTVNLLFGGFVLFICQWLKPTKVAVINNIVYFDISPILLIILTLICYFILYIIRRITASRTKDYLAVNISVTLKEKDFSFRGKIDTGCSLKEPFSGNSVIVCEKTIFKDIDLTQEEMRVIPFKSLGGEGICMGFRAENVSLDNKKIEEPIYIGLCENILTGEFKALVPENITGS